MPNGIQRVAVIGAGAAGLSAARHLLESGHTVVVYEKGSMVGGLWVYDNDSGLSAAYESLHINSEPRQTHYRGYPFPAGTPLFPSHYEVTRYLEAFADYFDIRRHIRFRSPVTSVRPVDGLPGRGWIVETSDGSQEIFDSVVVANGHQSTPAHPSWASRFSREYLHSHAYREPSFLRDKRVLVVGVGNSALDIAADACTVARKTYVSARSPVLIMPRMMFGIPSARIMARINKPFVPWPVQRQAMRTISQLFHGPMEQWGFRTPTKRTHPASSTTFMAHVAYHRILVRPGVEDVEGDIVRFTDGTREQVDTVIAATGYEISLPFLPPEVSPVNGRRLDVFNRVVHPLWPQLYFVGFFNVSGGANISMMDVQSQWVAALVSGTVGLPSQDAMKEHIRSERRFLARNFPETERYGLELDPRRYRREIARAMRQPAATGR